MVDKRNEEYALEVSDIHKSFYSNHVLKGISFGIKKGEILGLVGSNGAGKSTLMKIINGIYKQDKGHIKVEGTRVDYKDALGARESGIAMVYQEFSLVPTMSVAENMFLGVEHRKYGLIDDKKCVEDVKKAFLEFGVEIDPKEMVENLSVGDQQIVEIVKALLQKPSVLILDEPTASLTHKEINLLFEFIKRLKKQDISIFMISHHMQEIINICDRVVVLRNGEVVLDDLVSNISITSMVQSMIGRRLAEIEFLPPKNEIQRKNPVLEVENLVWGEKVSDVSLHVYPGEILGVAGLLGSGRTEILKCIYGLLKPTSGQIKMNGKVLKNNKPWEKIENGIFLVPENRREEGIVEIHSIQMNMLLPVWKRIKKGFFIDERASEAKTIDMKEKIKLKATGIDQEVQSLSGGNQQKVVFAKSLLTEPSVLLLDEPTVGIDVEAKSEIANLIREIADNNNGVVMVSSEMDEMERICDRVIILKQGQIVKELIRSNGDLITEEVLSREIQS